MTVEARSLHYGAELPHFRSVMSDMRDAHHDASAGADLVMSSCLLPAVPSLLDADICRKQLTKPPVAAGKA